MTCVWERHDLNGQRPVGLNRGFGFVEFELPEDAKAAVDNMHLSEIYGKVVKVSMANPSKLKDQSRAGTYLKMVARCEIEERLTLYFQHKVWNDDEWLQKNTSTKTENDTVVAEASQEDKPVAKEKSGKVKVFFEIKIGGSVSGRIEMEVCRHMIESKCRIHIQSFNNIS